MPSLQAMRAYVMEAWRRRGWKSSRVAEMSDDQVLAVYKRLKAEPEWKMYLDQLKSRTCQCEERKTPGHAFCRTCFMSLPLHMRKELYRKIGHGYELAYGRSLKVLTQKKSSHRPGEQQPMGA